MKSHNKLTFLCVICAPIAGLSYSLASETLYKEIVDQSLGKYKLEKSDNNHTIHFEQPLTSVRFIYNETGRIKNVVPVNDQEKILHAGMFVLMLRVTDDKIGIDEGWKACKTMFEDKDILLRGFIGSMSNLQLGRPNARGFVIPKNGELITDCSKLKNIEKSELIKEFTSKIAGDNNNVLIDIRKIFGSWHK